MTKQERAIIAQKEQYLYELLIRSEEMYGVDNEVFKYSLARWSVIDELVKELNIILE